MPSLPGSGNQTDQEVERVKKVNSGEQKVSQVVIEGQIGDTGVRCFIDSGSSISLICKQIVQRMGQMSQILPTSRRVFDFSGNHIPLHGTIDIKISVGTRTMKQCFVVCSSMDTEVLLGHDFLSINRCCLDYGKELLHLEGGKSVPFVPRLENVKKSHLIRGLSGQVIPADSVAYIQGRLPRHLKPCVGMVTPFGAAGEEGLLVASAVSEGRDQKVTLKVVNISSLPITISKRQILGRYGPIPDYVPISGANWGETSSVNMISSVITERWTREELFERLGLADRQGPQMTEEEEGQLREILWRYRNVFSYDDYDIGCSNMYTADIRLKEGAQPRWTNPIPTPYKLREEMDRNIQKMMEVGVVEELQQPSDWNSPIFLVKKKTAGSWRLVADLRCVNQECVGDSYPLPNLNHVLDSIGGDSIFSNFDLSKGFWQVPYSEESKKVTAFLYRGRQLCFARVIMGHKASSSKFTRMMEKLLGTLPIDQVIYFVDDVFLSSKTVAEHLTRLEKLLNRFQTANLKISPGKTELLKKEVEFVGIAISGDGVTITDDRVKALTSLPVPKSRKEVSEVLGAFNYIRKWVPGFSAITKPLHNILSGPKNRQFVWSDECNRAYEHLKELVSNRTTLSIPDPNDPFQSYEVTVDASMDGYGATLSQEIERDGVRERRIIAFYSKSVPCYKRARGQTRLEFDAMVAALEHWKVYLLNTKFTVVTDCKSLLSAEDSLFAKSDPTIIRKVQLLANYDFKIRHIAGETNTLADFLSRFPFRRTKTDAGTQTGEQCDAVCHHLKLGREGSQWALESMRANPTHFMSLTAPSTAGPRAPMSGSRNDLFSPVNSSLVSGYNPLLPENLKMVGCDAERTSMSESDGSSSSYISHPDNWVRVEGEAEMEDGNGVEGVSEWCGQDHPTRGQPEEQSELDSEQCSVSDLISEDDVTEQVYQLHGESDNSESEGAGEVNLDLDEPLSTGDVPVLLGDQTGSGIGDADTELEGAFDTDHFGFEWLDSCDQSEVHHRTIHHVEPSCWCPTRSASTVPEVLEVNAITEVPEGGGQLLDWREWETAQKEDDIFLVVRNWVIQGSRDVVQANRTPTELMSLWKQFNLLRVEDGVLQRRWNYTSTGEDRWLILVPEHRRELVMNRCHAELCGHAGVDNTMLCLRKWYYWPGMESDVKEFVAACINCGANKQPRAYGRAPMAKMMFHQFNDAIILDHIVPTSRSKTSRGNSAILTISDAWSNYVIAVPVGSQTSDENRKTVLESWIYRMGWPHEIICDNHRGFRGAPFRRFFELHGVKLTYGTAYKAASTARAEMNNKRTNTVLRATLHQTSPHNWDLHLAKVSFVLNCLKNRRTGYTANRLVYGRELNVPEILILDRDKHAEQNREQNIPAEVYRSSKELRDISRRVRKNMETDWGYAKKSYDKKCYDPGYSVGDQVFVKINCPAHKFSARWFGPVAVKRVMNPYLYVIKMSENEKEDKVVNISKLKLFRKTEIAEQNQAREIVIIEPDTVPVIPTPITASTSDTGEIEPTPVSLPVPDVSHDITSFPTIEPERGGSLWAGRLRRRIAKVISRVTRAGRR